MSAPADWLHTTDTCHTDERQAKAAGLLVHPSGLAHEHNPVSPVVQLWDYRNLYTLLLWVATGALLYWCLVASKRSPRTPNRLWGILVLLLPYAPAAHVGAS